MTADDDKKTCLYAHPVTLRSWSGTLRNVLEDISGTDTTTCTSTDGSSSYQLINIPVEASEMAAWEAALDIMHPPLAAARTSSPIHPYNAMELLQLADKYDMPGVKRESPCVLSQAANGISYQKQPLLSRRHRGC